MIFFRSYGRTRNKKKNEAKKRSDRREMKNKIKQMELLTLNETPFSCTMHILLFYSTQCQLLLLLLRIYFFAFLILFFLLFFVYTTEGIHVHRVHSRSQNLSIKKTPLQFTFLFLCASSSILFTLFWLQQSLSNGVGI